MVRAFVFSHFRSVNEGVQVKEGEVTVFPVVRSSLGDGVFHYHFVLRMHVNRARGRSIMVNGRFVGDFCLQNYFRGISFHQWE